MGRYNILRRSKRGLLFTHRATKLHHKTKCLAQDLVLLKVCYVSSFPYHKYRINVHFYETSCHKRIKVLSY